MPATFVIVDDDPAFRSVASVLLAARGFDVIGEADGGAAGIDVISKCEPSAVLLDFELPDGDGLTIAGGILRSQPNVRILLTSVGDHHPHPEELADAGVIAYVPKEQLGDVDFVSVLSL